MVWYGMVWYGIAWYGMVWYGMVWYGMAWLDVSWCGMAWYGMVCHDMVCLAIPIQSLASHPIPTDLRWISFATPPILSFLRGARLHSTSQCCNQKQERVKLGLEAVVPKCLRHYVWLKELFEKGFSEYLCCDLAQQKPSSVNFCLSIPSYLLDIILLLWHGAMLSLL